MRSACSAASSCVRRADEVAAAARLVQIVIQIRAGRDQAVDVAVLDQMRDDQPHAAGAERAGHAEEDRAVAAEHLLPDAPRGREVAPLKRDALHPREHFVGRQPGRDDERLNRLAEKARLAATHVTGIVLKTIRLLV